MKAVKGGLKEARVGTSWGGPELFVPGNHDTGKAASGRGTAGGDKDIMTKVVVEDRGKQGQRQNPGEEARVKNAAAERRKTAAA